MDGSDVRAHVLGVPRRGEELLVERYTTGSGPFYRPIGGGIEFGETSEEAVVREFREETGFETSATGFLGVVENVFEFAGTPGHEVSLVQRVEFETADPYEADRIRVEEGGGDRRWATWHTPAALRASEEPCYPRGVLDLLGDGDTVRVVSRD